MRAEQNGPVVDKVYGHGHVVGMQVQQKQWGWDRVKCVGPGEGLGWAAGKEKWGCC